MDQQVQKIKIDSQVPKLTPSGQLVLCIQSARGIEFSRRWTSLRYKLCSTDKVLSIETLCSDKNYALFLILITSIIFPFTVIPKKFQMDITEYSSHRWPDLLKASLYKDVDLLVKLILGHLGPRAPYVGPL